MPSTQRVEHLLKQIYGEKKGARGLERILPLIEAFPQRKKERAEFFTEKDVILITYGDTLSRPGEAPLKTFGEFAAAHLRTAVSGIHFLPFHEGRRRFG